MGQSKYKPNKVIKSMDELLEQEFVYHRGMLIHYGWFVSYQIRYAVRELKAGNFVSAIKSDPTSEGE